VRQTRRDLAALLLLSLAVRLAVAAWVAQPGYMDAYYYTVGAQNLAAGRGFSEPFLWNYMDDPDGLPHPGFLYWMPLPALLAAPFAALSPTSFLALQLPFVILSASLPLVAYVVARQASGVRRHAWAAGLLTLFSGFFFPYWTLPETFAPFALFGSLALWLAGQGGWQRRWWPASMLVGVWAGLAHLTRADGLLLLPLVALAPFISPPDNGRRLAGPAVRHASLAALGYLLVMTPWFARNLSLIGAPLSPAGTQTLWLTHYDDLFCYRCDLSLHTYLAWGWGNILCSKLFALWVNLQRFLAEGSLIFLFPFILVGLFRYRRQRAFVMATVYGLLLYAAMSLVFTFPGWRGGFFHSSAALLPFLHAAGVEGVDAAIGWLARRRRGWRAASARRVFTAAAVALAVALSLYAALRTVPDWNRADHVYRDIGHWLEVHASPGTTVMVGNPPALYSYGCSGGSRAQRRPGHAAGSLRPLRRFLRCGGRKSAGGIGGAVRGGERDRPGTERRFRQRKGSALPLCRDAVGGCSAAFVVS